MSGLELTKMVMEIGGEKTKEYLRTLNSKELNKVFLIYNNKKKKMNDDEKIEITVNSILNTLNIGYVFTENKTKLI